MASGRRPPDLLTQSRLEPKQDTVVSDAGIALDAVKGML